MNPLEGLLNAQMMQEYNTQLIMQAQMSSFGVSQSSGFSSVIKGIFGNPITGSLIGGAIGGIAGYALGGTFGTIVGYGAGATFGGLIGNYNYQNQMAQTLFNQYNLGGSFMPSYMPTGFNPMLNGGFSPQMYGGIPGSYGNYNQMMQLMMMIMMVQMLTQMPGNFSGIGMPIPPGYGMSIPGYGGGMPITGGYGGIPGYGGGYAGYGYGGYPNFGNVAPNPGVQIPRYGPNPSKAEIARMLEAAAHKYGVPVNILKAVAYNESRWNPRARGDHGYSFGMMQIYTKAHPDYNVMRGIQDPAYNIEYAARMLRRLYNRYHDWGMAVRRYNGAGPMARRYEARVLTYAQTQPWRKWGVA